MYNIDTAFLGHLGTNQLAGSSLAFCVMSIVSFFVWAPAYSLNSLCSQAIGAGNPKLAGNWFQLRIHTPPASPFFFDPTRTRRLSLAISTIASIPAVAVCC